MKPLLFSAAALLGSASLALAFVAGDQVRLTRGETLLFQGKPLQIGYKGQEFAVLRHDAFGPTVYVSFYREDGTLAAATLPAKSLEAAPPSPWEDLLHGAEALRDGQYDVASRWLARAALSAEYRSYAQPLQMRATGLVAATRQGAAGAVALAALGNGLRDLAAAWEKEGLLSLALAVDGAADRISTQAGAGAVAASKLADRAALEAKVAIATKAATRGRQAAGFRRLVEADKLLRAGLEAEPKRPDLAALAKKVSMDLKEAEAKYADADRMRRFPNGMPHALTALERGLKICTDHEGLRSLRKEMESALEERTAPPVTPALLAKANSKSPVATLQEARQLYTTRCTECHDLEMLESRSLTGWDKIVTSMAGRAKLSDAQKAKIMDYLAVAWAASDGN